MRLALALVLSVAAAVGSCRKPVLEGEAAYRKRMEEVVPQIEEATGLRFKTPPKLEVRTRQQVRQFLVARLNEPAVQREIAGQSAAYRLLGLIPETLDLRAFMIRLLEEQVIGYYDPGTKVLYVVEGAAPEYANITIIHELVHALQDQYLDLDSLQQVMGNDDRQMAAQAVIEGQAQYESLVILAGRGNPALALPTGMDQMRRAIREELTVQPMFSSAPMVIQESLLFPYLNGADFVGRFHERRAGRSVLDALPQSTEQILHDPAYFGAVPQPPVIVGLPPVTGAVYENTMGEFGTRLFFYKHLRTRTSGSADTTALIVAANAASGWGGDRFSVVRSAAGDGIVWVSVWDTGADAAEFVNALDDVCRLRYSAPAIEGARRRYAGAGRSVAIVTQDIGDRTAVLYVDVPAGASATLLDLARVTLR
jgi:hypothetical protein